MPDPIKIISLSGGLVNSRDESSLAEGELSIADDSFYKPNDPAIWKVPGRSEFNTTEEGAGIKQEIHFPLPWKARRISSGSDSKKSWGT